MGLLVLRPIACSQILNVVCLNCSAHLIDLSTTEFIFFSHRSLSNTAGTNPGKANTRQATMAVLQPYRGDYYLWHYLPSVPAAIIFLLIFLGCTFGLIWRSWKARVKFGIPFIIGTFCKSTQTTPTELLSSGFLTL